MIVQYCHEFPMKLLSEQMGAEKIKERPLRLAPTNQDCLDHGVGWIQHGMGASCLFFMLPSVLAGYLAISGRSKGYCTSYMILMNIFLCYVSTFSFGADYWYTG